jgi:hypothetical protein
MLTLIYSLATSDLDTVTNATLLIAEDGSYILRIPADADWTSAEIQINNYPAIDYQIQEQQIEINGHFYNQPENIWIDMSIAKGDKFGGSYRFPLDVVPIPDAMPRFSGNQAVAELKPSFWWRDADRTPYRFFWER